MLNNDAGPRDAMARRPRIGRGGSNNGPLASAPKGPAQAKRMARGSCGVKAQGVAPDSGTGFVRHRLPLVSNLLSSGMGSRFLQRFVKTMMVLLVALSLLTVGFAHRPALTGSDLAKAEYLSSMGLSAADLCAGQGDEDGGMAMGDCPACHLAASVLLPEPAASLMDIELRAAAVVLVPAEARGLGRTTNPATPVRAPPLA